VNIILIKENPLNETKTKIKENGEN